MNKYFNSKNLAIVIALIIFLIHYYSRTFIYNHWTNVLGWDVFSYYLYLPFTFIYHNIGMNDQSIIKHIFEVYNPSGTFYQAWKLPNGNWIPMYTLGFAILYSPFFLIGHLWASLSSYPADGFSFPYQFCISNGVMVYIIIGIFFIRKVLLHFFSEKITIIVMLLLLFGTNYFQEAAIDEMMPHAVLFSAFAIFLYLNIKWQLKPNYKNSISIGLIYGITVLARGSEIILIFIPLLWNVYDRESFKLKLTMLWKNRKFVIVAMVFAFIFPLIQIIHWKHVSGNFFVNSYQVTPGFDWLKPHIINVLFSYKKSWFLYTPMILFPIIGMFFMRKMNKNLFLPIFIFFILNFYMLASFGTWWQGGSFGMRYFVESYAIMAIPFGFLIKRVLEKKHYIKIIFFMIVAFFLFLNLFQTWQFNHWIIDGYRMTKEYYWKTFLKTNVKEEDRKLMDINRTFSENDRFDNPQDYNKKTICYMNFDSINSVYIDPVFLDTTNSISPPYCCRLTSDYIYSPTFRMPFNVITSKKHAWIKASLYFFPFFKLEESPVNIVILLNHNKNKYIEGYLAYNIGQKGYKLNAWNFISIDYLTPYPLSDDDMIEIYIWSQGGKQILLDNIQVDAYERKW